MNVIQGFFFFFFFWGGGGGGGCFCKIENFVYREINELEL